jgi:WD40 repeat protein
MAHSLAFVTWVDVVRELLMTHLHIPGLCDIVSHYARAFLGEHLHSIQYATGVDCLTAALSGDRVVTAHGYQLYVYGAFDGCRLTLTGHTAVIFEIAAHDDRIASCSKDCTARVWNSQTGECLACLSHPDWVVDVLQLNLHDTVTCCNDNHIRVWRSGECIFQSAQDAMTLMPLTSSKLVSCSFDDRMYVWDCATTPCTAAYVDSDQTVVMHIAPLGGSRFATHDSECIYIWTDCTWALKIDCRTTELCALGQGFLASGEPNGTVRVWNTFTGECLWTLVGHTAIVWSLAAMPDRKLASGSADCTVRVWDLTTGQCCYVMSQPTTCVKALVALDHTLVSLSTDRAMCVWE